MCGLTGAWSFAGAAQADLAARVSRMTGALVHRGPDDEGLWVDAPPGVALGFRRLAILDLSVNGHQPMHSSCGRFVVVFNGEVYNHAELRTELAQRGHPFRGTSDTEVVAEAVAEWGVTAAVPRLWGMFALAVWDRDTRRLTLVRDRIGKKPLYYHLAPSGLSFASELKALAAGRTERFTIDRDALASYFRYGYVPAPRTIYRDTWKVLPGTCVTLAPDRPPDVTEYWSAAGAVRDGTASRVDISDDEAVDHLEALLGDAVERRLVADVPVGALLSGGIDSSVIVALCQSRRTRPIKTFTVGFEEQGFDESAAARRIAQHLGTDHTELRLTADALLETVPRLPHVYDEPFCDSSQIPTLLVYELARKHVAVAVSGDGGDELFGGYTRYAWAAHVWNVARAIPAAFQAPMGHALRRIPVQSVNHAYARVQRVVPRAWRVSLPGEKLHKFSALLTAGHPDGLYHRLMSLWPEPTALVRGATEPAGAIGDEQYRTLLGNFTERMMLFDLLTYLPDDILVKVDRASMAVSLEARTPFLDHRVVEWSWRLPLHMKTRNGEAKWPLRQLACRHIPRALIDRPKMGFGVPIEQWLRGALRPWAEDLLDEGRLRRDGLLEAGPIRAAWRRHVDGVSSHHYQLWAVLMFQAWRDAWQAS